MKIEQTKYNGYLLRSSKHKLLLSVIEHFINLYINNICWVYIIGLCYSHRYHLPFLNIVVGIECE